MKRIGKKSKPFRYDLNKIPYYFTMEVTNNSRDLIWYTKCLNNYGQRLVTLYRRQ